METESGYIVVHISELHDFLGSDEVRHLSGGHAEPRAVYGKSPTQTERLIKLDWSAFESTLRMLSESDGRFMTDADIEWVVRLIARSLVRTTNRGETEKARALDDLLAMHERIYTLFFGARGPAWEESERYLKKFAPELFVALARRLSKASR